MVRNYYFKLNVIMGIIFYLFCVYKRKSPAVV